MRPLALIGSAIGWGSCRLAAEDGAEALRTAGVEERLRRTGHPVRWADMICSEPTLATYSYKAITETYPWVLEHNRRIFEAVSAVMKNGELPIVLGGDHSSTIGQYAAMCTHEASAGRLGIIWIDAHPDLNTLDTSPSGGLNGIGHRVNLGYGAEQFRPFALNAPAIRPENSVLIAARDIDPGERDFIESHNIRLFTMDEIRQRGFDAVLDEAVARVCDGTVGYGVSIDLDAFDPVDAPGVAFPIPDGLKAAEVLPAIAGLGNDPRLVGMELVEYAANKDVGGKTAELAIDLLAALFSAEHDAKQGGAAKEPVIA